jgi:hypothetical protein
MILLVHGTDQISRRLIRSRGGRYDRASAAWTVSVADRGEAEWLSWQLESKGCRVTVLRRAG